MAERVGGNVRRKRLAGRVEHAGVVGHYVAEVAVSTGSSSCVPESAVIVHLNASIIGSKVVLY